MIDPIQVIVSALAAWRIAHMIAWETGPFWIFVRFRSMLGIQHDHADPVEWGDRTEILMCNLCSTVWFGTFFFLLYFVFPLVVVLISVWGIAAFLVKVSTWLDQKTS